MNAEIEQEIRNYLPNILHMALVTAADNKPWACQVHFAYDDALNLYFCSNTKTRHCREIAINPFVAGSISVQHDHSDKPKCVDFEGVAEQLTEKTSQEAAYLAYDGRFPGRLDLAEYLKPEKGGGIYKITVSDYYVFDVTGKLSPPGKQHLPWKASN